MEYSFVDTALSADATTTGVVALLNGLTLGVTASTRTGRKIAMRKIDALVRFSAENPLPTPGAHVRWSLVYDKQSNGAAPAYTAVYDSITPTSLRNVSNLLRFDILAEESCVVTGATNAASNDPAPGQIQLVEFKENLELPTRYNTGNAGTVADIQTGGLFFCYCSNIAAGTGDVDCTGQIRVWFTD